jgi:hypothetical protein
VVEQLQGDDGQDGARVEARELVDYPQTGVADAGLEQRGQEAGKCALLGGVPREGLAAFEGLRAGWGRR